MTKLAEAIAPRQHSFFCHNAEEHKAIEAGAGVSVSRTADTVREGAGAALVDFNGRRRRRRHDAIAAPPWWTR